MLGNAFPKPKHLGWCPQRGGVAQFRERFPALGGGFPKFGEVFSHFREVLPRLSERLPGVFRPPADSLELHEAAAIGGLAGTSRDSKAGRLGRRAVLSSAVRPLSIGGRRIERNQASIIAHRFGPFLQFGCDRPSSPPPPSPVPAPPGWSPPGGASSTVSRTIEAGAASEVAKVPSAWGRKDAGGASRKRCSRSPCRSTGIRRFSIILEAQRA